MASVLGDEDRGQTALLDKVLDAAAQNGAELRLKLAHRLVEQMQVGIADQRPAEAGALLLAAGDGTRIALEYVLDLEQLGDAGNLGVDLALRQPGRLQGEGHVLAHGQWRIERVALEGHRHVAPDRRQHVHLAAGHRDFAARDLLEAGDHAQCRGLAAA